MSQGPQRALSWMAAGTAVFLLLLGGVLAVSFVQLDEFASEAHAQGDAATLRVHSQRIALASLALRDARDADERARWQQRLAESVQAFDRIQTALVEGQGLVDEHGGVYWHHPIRDQAIAREVQAAWQRWRLALGPLLAPAPGEPAVAAASDAALAQSQPLLDLLTRQEAVVAGELRADLARFRNGQLGAIAALGLVFGVLAFVTLGHMRRLGVQQREQVEATASARERAEQASQAKTQFLARMSHELRTPLNAVLGLSQLLRSELAEGRKLSSQHLATIEDAGRHLLALIDDTLDLARIEAGQMSVRCTPLRLSSVMTGATLACRADADRQGVRLSMRFDADDPETLYAEGDAVRVRQVLINLISNAIKYNRRGGSVDVMGLARGADAVGVRVSDDGPGMTEPQVAQLFQPFNRLGAEEGGVSGTGIGLSIAKRLAHLMHGDIEVRSTPGRGSVFTLVLPRAEYDSGFSATQPAPLETLAESEIGEGATLLYVEDNEVNIIVFEACLARRPGIRLLVARDADQAMRLARANAIDLVVLDLNLPDTNGLALYRMLRQMPQHHSLRAALLTADALPATAEAARRVGISRVWTKPLDPAALLAEIDEVLAERGVVTSP
ncbi:MAG: ATP-binding protein [Aquincola sp.]|nr:ATP-binding protein [Aquincola sp.]